MKIKGNTVGTTMPRTDFNQENPAKADYLKGRDNLMHLIADAKSAGDNAKTAANNHRDDKNNPHGVTPEQIGARPETWTPTAEEVGAVTEAQVSTMINDALGVIENGSY